MPDGGKALAEFPHPGSVQVDVGIYIAGENLQSFLREEYAAFIQKNKSRFALVRLQKFKQWVGNRYDKGFFHVVLSELKQRLKEAGAEDVLIKSYNSSAIDSNKID